MARVITRHWDALFTVTAMSVEAMLIWWMRDSVEGWALAATITISAWALALTARQWQESPEKPDWLVFAAMVQLVVLGVVVGLSHEAANRSPRDLFWYVPMMVAITQFSVAVLTARKV